MTILLIDNDQDDQFFFQNAVKKIDSTIECIAASNAQSALNFLSNEEYELPEVIFLDLTMTLDNGKGTLQALKHSVSMRNIPVCIYTASDSEADRKTTHHLGAIGYVIKERSFKQLTSSIKSVLTTLDRNGAGVSIGNERHS